MKVMSHTAVGGKSESGSRVSVSFQAVVLSLSDNVATAISDLGSGTSVDVATPDAITKMKVANEPISFGHKFATNPIRSGANVVKYGECIGIASEDISVGQHVHVHNVESQRGRGDRASAEFSQEPPGVTTRTEMPK